MTQTKQSGTHCLKMLIIYAGMVVGLIAVPAASAQTGGADPEQQKIAAVMSIINMYLLDGQYVSGHLYIDTNGNGSQDTGEPDLADVDVLITDSVGNKQTVATDANGDWIAAVPAGSTTADVDETDPQYPVSHTQTEGTDPTVVVAESSVTTDAGNDGYQPPTGTVMHHIYEDTNGNATQDTGEPDLSGVQVEITDSAGTVVTVATDANGDIPPTSVPAGDTVLDIVDGSLPANIGQTEGTDPTTVEVPSNGAAGDVDGYRPPPDGLAIPLTINELSPDTFQVSQGNAVFGQFDLQEEGIEFCFDLASNIPLQAGDIVVEVNGEAVTAVEGKDNCYQIPEHLQRDINYVAIQVVNPAVTLTITRVELAASVQTELGLVKLTRGGWDEAAVRKVLKIFAFGGHATDTQIQIWADMYASDAIAEMLNFDEHNLKLSPLVTGETYTDSATLFDEDGIGTLEGWANFISDDASNLPITTEGNSRENLGLDGGNFDDGYNRMITVRGLNPFRQRIGFWETNYHLATNLDASVSRRQMARYYDEIMEAHQAGLPYHDVMGVAAKSAAAAMQYGHRNNRWNFGTGECDCNDDFAREIHQLYYGIFGEGDPNHEDVTIPETAKLLTDMPVPYISGFGFDLAVDFQTNDHFPGAVMIFDQAIYAPIAGVDAEQKIDNLMPVSIQHPESLQNLPVMIISVLADDNLNEFRKDELRAAWAALGTDKDFLHFIQTYAIAEIFHGPNQFKYFTTHERALYLANKNNLDNLEAYYGGASTDGGSRAGRTVGSIITEDFAGDFFKPLHNVFGGQTSFEASDSAAAFEKNFNRLTDDEHHLRNSVVCNTCDQGQPWEKKWPDVLPMRADGKYYVEDIAPWLWNHVVGNLDNYTELERAHLYSLLGAVRIDLDDDNNGDYPLDFNFVMCLIEDYQVTEAASDAPIIDLLTDSTWDDYCRENDDGGIFLPHELDALNAELSGDDIANDPEIQSILSELGQVTMPFDATAGFGSSNVPDGGANLRKHAREAVSNALGFIYTTPFVFAEGQ